MEEFIPEIPVDILGENISAFGPHNLYYYNVIYKHVQYVSYFSHARNSP